MKTEHAVPWKVCLARFKGVPPRRVTSMIANRMVQSKGICFTRGWFVLVFSAETTRARVTGHFSRA